MKKKFLGFVFMMLVLTEVIKADWRYYVWTYEYKVMKEEWLELEHYITFSTPVRDEMRGSIMTEHQIEIETGIAKNTDFAIYQIFNQNPAGEFKYKGYKLRLRHKIGEKNEYFVDMLGYLEYRGVPDLSEHKVELKKIFAKDFDKLNISLNSGFEFVKKDEWKYEYIYAFGTSYGMLDFLRIGGEIKGTLKEHYLGPTIFIKLQKLWISIGSAIAISEVKAGAPVFQLRLISGIGL